MQQPPLTRTETPQRFGGRIDFRDHAPGGWWGVGGGESACQLVFWRGGVAHVSPGCAWMTRCVLRDYSSLLH